MKLELNLPDLSLQGMADFFRVPLPLPSKAEAKAWELKPMYTPDLYQLEKRPFSLLFEYGELLLGMPRHKSLLNQLPLAMAYTYENMALWRKNMGRKSFALAMNWHPENRPVPHTRIQGHIYQVPSMHLMTLDNYRSNGVSFKRKRLPLVLSDGQLAEAWGYVALKEEWAPQINWDHNFYRRSGGSDFSLVNRFQDQQDQNKRFYRFSEFDLLKNNISNTVVRPKLVIPALPEYNVEYKGDIEARRKRFIELNETRSKEYNELTVKQVSKS